MKRTAAKAVSLLLVLCLSVCCFTACTQIVQIRFVDKDGNDRFAPVAGTQTADTTTPDTTALARESEPAATSAPAAEESTTAVPAAQQTETTVQAAEPASTEAPATQPPATQAPATEAPATEAPATQPPATEPPATQPPAGFNYQPLNKKGDLYRADCTGKIWAKIVGSCYILFRDIDETNEWGEQGKVYELHVTYVKVGENYSMWSDGYWELDSAGTQLTLTPVNQGENGNIGAQVGSSKTFTGKDGVFEIPVTFEQGGKTTVILDLKNPLG